MNKLLTGHVRDPDEVAFLDESKPTPIANGTREVKSSPITHSTPVKSDRNMLASPIMVDSDGDPTMDSDDEEDDGDGDF